MDQREIIINIAVNRDCPLYEAGDEFLMVGRAMYMPGEKPACVTLMMDILKARPGQAISAECAEGPRFNCSGEKTHCTGEVELICMAGDVCADSGNTAEQNREIIGLLSGFNIFEGLSEASLRRLANRLKMKKFGGGGMILKQGDPGTRLYIVVSGAVEVVGGNGPRVARLGNGEVFGEMSLLSGDPVTATVRAMEPTWVLYVKGADFRNMLTWFPTLKMYFARLLSRRLALTNAARLKDIDSAMAGRLSDIPPTELVQTLNQNQKTGVLHIFGERGEAMLCFNEGGLVSARYRDMTGKEAFFALLRQRTGRFKFSPGMPAEMENCPEIGDFMWLLMEGLNRMDEERGR